MHEAVKNCALMRAARVASAHRRVRLLKQTIIVDLAGLKLQHFYSAREYLKRQIWVGSNHFPDCTYKSFFINAPFVFRAIWSVVKLWLHPRSVKKVVIVGHGEGTIAKALVDNGIPRESLPVWCGGSNGGIALGDWVRGTAERPWA